MHMNEKGSQLLGQLIMQLRRLERHPHTFGEAGPLTPSEIHTVDAIGPENDILIGELAERLKITKGAASQMVSRLEKKGIIRRSPHPDDSRAVLIRLTEKGKHAYAMHETMHEHFYDELRRLLEPEEIEIFEKCLQKLTKHLQ